MTGFELHERLAADTLPVCDIGLCELRLMNDARFPWVVLVPKRPDVREVHDLTPLDQTMLTFETTQMSKLLQEKTAAHKMNVAALGNQVPQLHVHIIARFENDAAWPSPVWGSGVAEPYTGPSAEELITRLTETL
ncbi:MAG: HIT family protein [Pseudomonadota bacterium]